MELDLDQELTVLYLEKFLHPTHLFDHPTELLELVQQCVHLDNKVCTWTAGNKVRPQCFKGNEKFLQHSSNKTKDLTIVPVRPLASVKEFFCLIYICLG